MLSHFPFYDICWGEALETHNDIHMDKHAKKLLMIIIYYVQM